MNTKTIPFARSFSIITLAAAGAFAALAAGCNSDGIFVTGDYPGASAGLETSSGEDSDSDVADTDPTGDETTGGDEDPTTTSTSDGSTSTSTGDETLSGSDSDSESSSTGDPCTPATCQNLVEQAIEHGFYSEDYHPNNVGVCEFEGHSEGVILNWVEAQVVSMMALRGGTYHWPIDHDLLNPFDPEKLVFVGYSKGRVLQTLELMGIISEIPEDWDQPVDCLEDLSTMQALVDYGPYEIPVKDFQFEHSPGDEYQVIYAHEVGNLSDFGANQFAIDLTWEQGDLPTDCTLTLMRSDGAHPSSSVILEQGVNLLELPSAYFSAGVNRIELSCVIAAAGGKFTTWGNLLHDGVKELYHHKYDSPQEQTVTP